MDIASAMPHCKSYLTTTSNLVIRNHHERNFLIPGMGTRQICFGVSSALACDCLSGGVQVKFMLSGTRYATMSLTDWLAWTTHHAHSAPPLLCFHRVPSAIILIGGNTYVDLSCKTIITPNLWVSEHTKQIWTCRKECTRAHANDFVDLRSSNVLSWAEFSTCI